MAAPENPIIINIMPSYGAILVGCFLSQAVWGISTLQVFMYFKNFEHDHMAVKALVVGLWMADTANQILLLKSGFPVLILEYGRIAGLLENSMDTTVHTLVQSAIVFVVQLYFIRRIYVFGKKKLWVKVATPLLFALALWQIVGVIVYWVYAMNKPLAEQTRDFYVNINVSIRVAAFVVDVAVALGMVWLLTWNQSNYISQTKKMVFRVLIVIINSGIWTALLATMVLILLKVYPKDLYFCIFEFTLSSVYLSTLLANLNARNYVRGRTGAYSDSSNGLTLGAIRGSSNQSAGGTFLGDTPSKIMISKQSDIYAEPEYSIKS